MVVPQRVPDSYVKSTVAAKMEDRLPSMSSLILSRSRLERTIMDFDLYPALRAQRNDRRCRRTHARRYRSATRRPESRSASATSVVIRTSRRRSRHGWPRCSSMENLRDRERLADQTNRFLESQVEGAKARPDRPREDARGVQATICAASCRRSWTATSSRSECADAAAGDDRNGQSCTRATVAHRAADRGRTDAAHRGNVGGRPERRGAGPADHCAAARRRADCSWSKRGAATPEHPDVRVLERSVRDLEAKAKEEEARTLARSPEEPIPTTSVPRRSSRVRNTSAICRRNWRSSIISSASTTRKSASSNNRWPNFRRRSTRASDA